MTADLEFALPLDLQSASVDGWPDERPVTTAPTQMWPAIASAAAAPGKARTELTGRWLIAGACLLRAGLAVAMGVTSFHAQFTYIFATKRQWAPAVLEALGLDAGAVIFSLLGIALARLGRGAAVERVLVVTCALGSCGMNVLNANLGSPRSVAVYAMPPVLFAVTSDRLVAVIRQAAVGRAVDDTAERSAWRLPGRMLLYCLRFTVDRHGTARGVRQAILNATPLPQAAPPAAEEYPDPLYAVLDEIRRIDLAGKSQVGRRDESPRRPGENGELELARSRRDPDRQRTTKTARFLALVNDMYGPLAEFPLANVYKVSAELAPAVRLHDGSARAALRAAVLAAQGGAE